MARDPLTLVVALDGAGRAAGELYDDDGRSFAFRRGVCLHRAFAIADGVLSSRAAPGGACSMASGATVERLVVLGLRADRAWRAARAGARRARPAVAARRAARGGARRAQAWAAPGRRLGGQLHGGRRGRLRRARRRAAVLAQGSEMRLCTGLAIAGCFGRCMHGGPVRWLQVCLGSQVAG